MFVNPLEYVQRKLSRAGELFQNSITQVDAQGNTFRPKGQITKNNRSLPSYYVPGSGYYDGNTGAFLGPAAKKGTYTASDRKNADPVSGYTAPAPRDYRSGAPTVINAGRRRGVSGASIAGKTTVKVPPAYGEQQVNFTINPWNQQIEAAENANLFQQSPDALASYAQQKQGELAALGMPTTSIDNPTGTLGALTYGTATGIKVPADIKPQAYGTSATMGVRSGMLKDTWNVSAQQDAYMARLQNSGNAITTGDTKVDALANDIGWKRVQELGGLSSERGMSYARADLLIRANRIKDPAEREAFLQKGRQYLEEAKAKESYGVNPNVKISNTPIAGTSNLDPKTAQAAKLQIPATAVGKANSGTYGMNPTAGMMSQQTQGTLQPGSPTAPVSNAAPVAPPSAVSSPGMFTPTNAINTNLQSSPYSPAAGLDQYVKDRNKRYGRYSNYMDMQQSMANQNPFMQRLDPITQQLSGMAQDRFNPSLQEQLRYLGQ